MFINRHVVTLAVLFREPEGRIGNAGIGAKVGHGVLDGQLDDLLASLGVGGDRQLAVFVAGGAGGLAHGFNLLGHRQDNGT